MFTGRMGTIAVFCSYAREDQAIRAALERYLAPLREQRIIDDWYDSRISPGAKWDAEIQSALERSRLLLFIVTPDLLRSRYVSEVEIPRGLERERAGECRVLPILARRADWKESPLSRFQALPGGGRWLDAIEDREGALRELVSGIQEVCRTIVDWENPYKRAAVGDWTYQEQTLTVAGGESMTGEGTEELVARTETEAIVRMEMLLNGEFTERTVSIDLTRPLEDRMGEIMRQGGAPLPPNLELSTGPAQYGEEHVSIGGRRYETVRARREFTLALRGFRQSGHATQWRSIDVPLFGLVKGEAELPGWRQYQVLLDWGRGDAAERKPRLGGLRPPRAEPLPWPPSPPAQGGHSSGAPVPGRAGLQQSYAPESMRAAPAAVGPGRWVGQMMAWGTPTHLDLILHPNGMLQGQQNTMGMPTDLHGRWGYDPGANLLTLQVVVSTFGVPTSQEVVQVRITGEHAGLLQGSDAMGRAFYFQRVG